jgi:hypothetical protein
MPFDLTIMKHGCGGHGAASNSIRKVCTAHPTKRRHLKSCRVCHAHLLHMMITPIRRYTVPIPNRSHDATRTGQGDMALDSMVVKRGRDAHRASSNSMQKVCMAHPTKRRHLKSCRVCHAHLLQVMITPIGSHAMQGNMPLDLTVMKRGCGGHGAALNSMRKVCTAHPTKSSRLARTCRSTPGCVPTWSRPSTGPRTPS